MMNLLQRSLRSDAASANTNPSSTGKPTKAAVGTGVMGGLHNSGPLSVGPSSGYSTNDYYFKTYDSPHFSQPGYFMGGASLPSSTLPFNNFDNDRLLNQGQSDACKKKHVQHTHQQHSQSQSQRTSSMSNYFDNYANYGKLFPSSCLQYLHQHNHLEEIIVAQQLFSRLNWSAANRPVTVNYNDKYVDNYSKPLKAYHRMNESFEPLTKYTYNDKPNEIIDSYTVPIFMNNQFGSISATHCPLNYEKNILGYQGNANDYYRLSFLETHIYQPLDMASSPQHLPHHRGNNQQFMHNEWIKTNLENLRSYFKPTHNEILVNVEKKAKFPFIIFGNPGPKFNTTNGLIDHDPFLIMPTATSINLSHELRITDGLFEVCDYALSRECLMEDYDDNLKSVKKPLGYIISTYQTFPGEDNLKLEETWFNWTGASHLTKTLPESIGLGRLLFFKRRDLHLLKSDCLKQFVDNELPIFTYVLLCELFNLKEAHLAVTCAIIDQLRARCCGYTALNINCT